MGRISKRRLNTDLEERIYEILWQHIAALSTPYLVKEFLQSLLSHTEQVMLSKRLAIAILLSRGYNYDNIDKTLKVSKSTIATVQRQLLMGAPGYMRAAQESSKRREKEKVWDALDELLLKITRPAREGSELFKVKSEAGRELRKRKYQHSEL